MQVENGKKNKYLTSLDSWAIYWVMKIIERPNKKRRKVIRLQSGEFAELDANQQRMRLPQLNKFHKNRVKYGTAF